MQNNYTKIFFLIAYMAFAAVSCWATSESLHMLLPTWPLLFCYVVTIGFFIIASFGTKLIVDSFNPNIYVPKRGIRLVGGLLIVLIFWIVCSLPTNTHTFFYRSVAADVAQDDIATTKGYLGQLVSNTNTENAINKEIAKFDNEIKSKLADLETEIMNEANPGFGPNAKKILDQFAALLDVPSVDPISYKNTSEQERKKLVKDYRKKIFAQAEVKKQNIRASMLAVNTKQFQKEARISSDNLTFVESSLMEDMSRINDINFAHDVDNRLQKAYTTIKTYRQFVIFDSKEDQGRYPAQNMVTKVKRLMSVFDVWKDFFKGMYKGHGFIFWIIISVLVDVAAFIFFDLAFRKSEL